jgi:hypothetical protein
MRNKTIPYGIHFTGGVTMAIRFDGYIDKDGNVSLTAPQWFVDRVISAIEEEFDVIMVNENEKKSG